MNTVKMYVVNCTQQVQDFIYQLPETRGPRVQPIAIGGYIQVSGDLGQPDIDAIIKQHGRYGLVREEEVDRTKAFIGLYYTVDRRPKMGRVYEAISHNVTVLEERGKQTRAEAAVATTTAIENQVPTGSLKELEMSVVEARSGGKEVTENPSIAEGFRITRDHNGPPAPETRAERNKRQRRATA